MVRSWPCPTMSGLGPLYLSQARRRLAAPSAAAEGAHGSVGEYAPPSGDVLSRHDLAEHPIDFGARVRARRVDRAGGWLAAVAVEKVVQERRDDRELERRDEPPEHTRHGGEVELEPGWDRDRRCAVVVGVGG